MEEAILTLLMATVSTVAVAAGWVEVESHQVGTKHVHPTAIERTSNTVKALVLIDFRTVQGPPLDSPFRSSILQNEYDCGGKRVRGVSYANFTEPMASSEVVQVNRKAGAPSDWYSAVSPSGKLDLALEFVCKK